jgi:hypothetical protein
MMRYEWPGAREQPAAMSNSNCGRACSMSGICSRVSCQERAQPSHASVLSCELGYDVDRRFACELSQQSQESLSRSSAQDAMVIHVELSDRVDAAGFPNAGKLRPIKVPIVNVCNMARRDVIERPVYIALPSLSTINAERLHMCCRFRSKVSALYCNAHWSVRLTDGIPRCCLLSEDSCTITQRQDLSCVAKYQSAFCS